jgi:hypothetical protein
MAARLADIANAEWALTALDESLRSALAEYSSAIPLTTETYFQLPGTGREIALSDLPNLINVLDVWWPFDPDKEVWPPNQVAGFRVWWDDAQPLLLLDSKTSNQPQIDDNLRIWYSKPHTIAGLDAAATTTVFPLHESMLITGAAGYAASMALVNELGSIKVSNTQALSLHTWAADRLKEYRAWLAAVASAGPSSAEPFGSGWGIDKWDANRNPRSGRVLP